MKKLMLLLSLCYSSLSVGQTLTTRQVYDYAPGDVFQWKYTEIYDHLISSHCAFPSIDTYNTDSVISKYYSNAKDTVFYSVYSTSYTPVRCDPRLPPLFSSKTQVYTYTKLDSAVSYKNFSCKPQSDTFYVSSRYCGKKVVQIHSNQTKDCFEPLIWSATFIEGCGGPYIDYYEPGIPRYTNTLIYYKKGNVACGSYVPVGITEQMSEPIHLYPNPSDGKFRFTYINAEVHMLEVSDVVGNIILKTMTENGTAEINLTNQPKGIYFLRVHDSKRSFPAQKMVKQ